MVSKTIYVCTSGEYSDYRVVAIFDEKELAEIFCQKFDSRIEEMELNPLAPQLRAGFNCYFLRMDMAGNTSELHLEDSTYYVNHEAGFDVNGNMYFSCMAKDDQHAVKIANEHRSMLIATNQWGFK